MSEARLAGVRGSGGPENALADGIGLPLTDHEEDDLVGRREHGQRHRHALDILVWDCNGTALTLLEDGGAREERSSVSVRAQTL